MFVCPINTTLKSFGVINRPITHSRDNTTGRALDIQNEVTDNIRNNLTDFTTVDVFQNEFVDIISQAVIVLN